MILSTKMTEFRYHSPELNKTNTIFHLILTWECRRIKNQVGVAKQYDPEFKL